MKVNLVSDTITRPSKGMLEAMINANVGDDVFKEDPSINFLEKKIAEMFGMEAALFFPTGTMSNQAAIKYHTQPGDQIICDHYAHIYNYESGGVSFNSGVSCKLIRGNKGMISATAVKKNINNKESYFVPRTRLVCVENTTNKGGGACYDFQVLKEIKEVCKENGLAYHLDGARLWNAMCETNATPKDYGNIFDTISLCFSKGLGCPVGSILVGSKKAMNEIIRIRKILGGGMRQSGYLAAAAIYAIENQWKSLKNDHHKAKEIEEVLKNKTYVDKIIPVETNIIIFSLQKDIDTNNFINSFQKKGVFFSDMGANKIRMVTHRDYTEPQHNYLLELLQKK